MEVLFFCECLFQLERIIFMLLYNTVKFHSKIASVIVYHNDCLPLLTTDNLVGAKDPRTLASIKEQDNSEV